MSKTPDVFTPSDIRLFAKTLVEVPVPPLNLVPDSADEVIKNPIRILDSVTGGHGEGPITRFVTGADAAIRMLVPAYIGLAAINGLMNNPNSILASLFPDLPSIPFIGEPTYMEAIMWSAYYNLLYRPGMFLAKDILGVHKKLDAKLNLKPEDKSNLRTKEDDRPPVDWM